jgi:hypothetical protein
MPTASPATPGLNGHVPLLDGGQAPAPVPPIDRAEQNRRNALASTGPTSAEGKAVVALNALKHGLRSSRPVVTGMESAEGWESHRVAVVEDLAPMGAVETALAERAALYLWRLGRVLDHETALIETGRAATAGDIAAGTLAPHEADVSTKAGPLAQNAVPRARQNLRDTTASIERWRKAAAWIEALIPPYSPPARRRRKAKESADDESDDRTFPGPEVLEVFQTINGKGDEALDLESGEFLGEAGFFCGRGGDLYRRRYSWPARRVRGGLEALGRAKGLQPHSFRSMYLAVYRSLIEEWEDRQAEERRTLDRLQKALDSHVEGLRRRRTLPGPESLASCVRYESHLERGLYRTLQELSRLQALRQPGRPFVSAVGVVVRREVSETSPVGLFGRNGVGMLTDGRDG